MNVTERQIQSVKKTRITTNATTMQRHTHTHTHTHTHSLTYTHTHSLTYTHTHSHTFPHSHKYKHARMHTRAHTHTHTHLQHQMAPANVSLSGKQSPRLSFSLINRLAEISRSRRLKLGPGQPRARPAPQSSETSRWSTVTPSLVPTKYAFLFSLHSKTAMLFTHTIH